MLLIATRYVFYISTSVKHRLTALKEVLFGVTMVRYTKEQAQTKAKTSFDYLWSLLYKSEFKRV